MGCSVNTATREFNDDRTDLSVKVPGGSIEIKRWFYRDKWRWEHIRNNLSFKQNSLGNGIESIDKGGVTYKSSPTQDDIYISGTYKIIRKSDGTYRWEDKSGNWKTFDETGRMTAYGTRNGVVGKLLYESGADGKLAGVTDRNNNQVIWYEYDGDGNISAVHDTDNRRVEYAYTDGVLTSITDLGGNTTTYEYNENGQITRKVDAGGRPTIVTYDGYGNVASVVEQNGSGHFFEFDYNSAKKEFYARITTSSGMIKEVWYDRNGETKRVDVNGRTMQKIAKDGRNLIITDEKGNVTRKEFDEWDNLTKIIYPDGSVKTYEYEHTFNRRIRENDENGIITEFEYDANGNLTTPIKQMERRTS